MVGQTSSKLSLQDGRLPPSTPLASYSHSRGLFVWPCADERFDGLTWSWEGMPSASSFRRCHPPFHARKGGLAAAFAAATLPARLHNLFSGVLQGNVGPCNRLRSVRTRLRGRGFGGMTLLPHLVHASCMVQTGQAPRAASTTQGSTKASCHGSLHADAAGTCHPDFAEGLCDVGVEGRQVQQAGASRAINRCV